MKIITIVCTHHRYHLLERALQSVAAQQYAPDAVFVVSDSEVSHHSAEQRLCDTFAYRFVANRRTANYAGALNTAITSILKTYELTDDLYVAFLDDDDTWHETYLQTIVHAHTNVDIYLAEINRVDVAKTKHMPLPPQLSYDDFLAGNPGVGGSNTFVRLKTLLHAGTFDEAMPATVDRDVFVRLFQLHPTYKIISKPLVNVYVDTERPRITTNTQHKQESYRYFYYKYKAFMSAETKASFFDRAERFFHIPKEHITKPVPSLAAITTEAIQFAVPKDYFFVIGFIAGDLHLANRILKNIVAQQIPVDMVVIINNTDGDASQFHTLSAATERIIISKETWQANLQQKMYGAYFSKFTAINSIAVGRTILQYNLYHATYHIANPVYWIIDDDVQFKTTFQTNTSASFDLFEIIQQYKDTTDALIGSVSLDAPLPMFSCIRGQLVDAWYSQAQAISATADLKNIRAIPDAYYDITDACTHHTETPIYYQSNLPKDIPAYFSGKAVSRPALQRALQGEYRLATNRGPNTLVFNKELLRSYPVVGMEINDTFSRRGDLSWALMSQVFSEYNFVVHTMSLQQDRPLQTFNMVKELDKSAHDIIGYASNKALLATVAEIRQHTAIQRPIHILEELAKDPYATLFYDVFESYVQHRKARFLMNYYRIQGLLHMLATEHQNEVAAYQSQFKDEVLQTNFLEVLVTALQKTKVQQYLSNLGDMLWSYTSAVTKQIAQETTQASFIQKQLGIAKTLTPLGEGSEGKVFTDGNYIYKAFYTIRDHEWTFLQQLETHFKHCAYLEALDFYKIGAHKYIRYPYREFAPIAAVTKAEMIALLRFCYQHGFVFTNIKPKNFIRTSAGQLKLIDYGKSFEAYTEKRFINSVKRASLLIQYPTLEETQFKKYIKRINANQQFDAISDWKAIWEAVKADAVVHNTYPQL
jgi:glycosyltransferase involved in cell wall biosynthesis